jgi:predicted dienelactone hydrolase
MRRLQFLTSVVALVFIGSACSSAGSSTAATPSPTTTAPTTTAPGSTTASTTTAAPTTTVDAATAASAYTEAGPYPVGVTTLTMKSGVKVEVWYPAVAGSKGTETYDIKEFTPAALTALIKGNTPTTFSYPATRDAAVADGKYPVVLFSHGFLGWRNYATVLTAHLASWGMVVAAPDHKSRDLPHLLEVMGPTKRPADTSTQELLGALDLLTAQSADATSRFHDRVDTTKVATMGHSAGGGTAWHAALDPRVSGYVMLATGTIGLGGGATAGGTTTTTAPKLPDKPSLYVAGSADSVVPAAKVSKPSFDASPAPSAYWLIDGAGHHAFDDICLVGNGLGIIGVAEKAGLKGFLDSTPGIRKLGDDGCHPPATPVKDTTPVVRHSVTAWLRYLLGIDAQPVGLDASVESHYATGVHVTTK